MQNDSTPPSSKQRGFQDSLNELDRLDEIEELKSRAQERFNKRDVQATEQLITKGLEIDPENSFFQQLSMQVADLQRRNRQRFNLMIATGAVLLIITILGLLFGVYLPQAEEDREKQQTLDVLDALAQARTETRSAVIIATNDANATKMIGETLTAVYTATVNAEESAIAAQTQIVQAAIDQATSTQLAKTSIPLTQVQEEIAFFASETARVKAQNELLATSTFTPSHTPTYTPTDTPTATNTPTDTPTATNTPTDTPTDTPTATLTPTATFTSTATPAVLTLLSNIYARSEPSYDARITNSSLVRGINIQVKEIYINERLDEVWYYVTTPDGRSGYGWIPELSSGTLSWIGDYPEAIVTHEVED